MAITDATFIGRSLTGRLFSTSITAATVAIAVALMLVLLGMRDAGRQAFERGYGNMHMLITKEDSALVSMLNSVYYAGAPRRALSAEEFTRLEASAPWDWFIPTQIGDSYRNRPVMATTRAFFEAFVPAPNIPWELAEGRFFSDTFEIVVGADAARGTGLRVGDTISLTHGAPGPGGRLPDGAHAHDEFTYTVVGILAPTGSAHDRALFSTLEGSWVLHAHDRRLAESGPGISLTTTADLLDRDRLVTGIYARLITREGRTIPANLQQVFDQLRRDPTVTVAQPFQEINALFQIVGNIDRIIIGLAAVVLVSSGIGI
ncbi:MAG: ABC transporter permease, partial [Planctomycetota bacterium]